MHEAFAQARKNHAPYDLWWRKYALWLIIRDVDALLALSPEDATWVRRKLKARAALRQLLTCGFSCDRVLDIMGFWGATNVTLVDALWARGNTPAKGLRLVDGVSTRLWGGLAGRPYSHEAYAASIPDALLPIMGYDWLRYLCRGPGLVPVSFVARCVKVLPHLPPGHFYEGNDTNTAGVCLRCYCFANQVRPDIVGEDKYGHRRLYWLTLADDAQASGSGEWLAISEACAAKDPGGKLMRILWTRKCPRECTADW